MQFLDSALERLPFRVEAIQTDNGAEEFSRMLVGVLIDDTGVFNDKLREWEDHSNRHRPRGALGGQTPYARLKQKAQTPL
ncbi:hypothetical protein [Streptomyces sp. NPDC004266]|uniref:hypothetical protein n=1 Tax=Streptomyces sp. NPDC004266 TaxID=3364693 RepID=UPI00368F6118